MQELANVVRARILSVGSNPELSGATVHVLEYKRDKQRYVILLEPELGDAATNSMCLPVNLL